MTVFDGRALRSGVLSDAGSRSFVVVRADEKGVGPHHSCTPEKRVGPHHSCTPERRCS